MKIKLKECFRKINTNLKKRSTNIKKTGHIEHSHKQNHNIFEMFLEFEIVSWVTVNILTDITIIHNSSQLIESEVLNDVLF